jgi:NADP-dependent 3-hydroxy acid dehydrogenase YdfG
VAKALGRAGAQVVIAARCADQLAAAATELRDAGIDARGVVADLFSAAAAPVNRVHLLARGARRTIAR